MELQNVDQLTKDSDVPEVKKAERQKQFFVIYRGEDKKFLHCIKFGKSKKLVKADFRAEGFTIKGVFSQKDINNVLNYEFTDVNVSNSTIEYLRDNLDFWDANKSDS